MRYLYGYTVPEVRQMIFERARQKGIPVRKKDLFPQNGNGVTHEQLRQAFFDFRSGRTPGFLKKLYPNYFKPQGPPLSYSNRGIPDPGGAKERCSLYWVFCPECNTAHSKLEARSGKCFNCDARLFQ